MLTATFFFFYYKKLLILEVLKQNNLSNFQNTH